MTRKKPAIHVGGAAAVPPPSPLQKATNKAKVLVVEDYEDAREMYQEFLEFEGFEVETAKDGLEALERAKHSRPDLILMDMSLPLVNGWEATRRLKEDEETADIPVVALTGHAFPGHADKAKQVGCDAFVTKPALPQDVADRIRSMLSQPRSKPRTK